MPARYHCRAMRSLSLAGVVLLLSTACTALDSEGTVFSFAFIRNVNPDITNQVLSASVLNGNNKDCEFTITTRADYHLSTMPSNTTTTVPALSLVEVRLIRLVYLSFLFLISIPTWYGFNYTGKGVQDDLYLTLEAFSSCAVTVIANNYNSVTNQGDSYLVLPLSWGAVSYTFSLPATAKTLNDQYEQIFILPAAGTSSVTLTEFGATSSTHTFKVTYGDYPAVFIGQNTPNGNSRTYHITSSGPILIVAGVTCIGRDYDSCDHAIFMPQAAAVGDCFDYEVYDDDHVAFLPTTSQFYIDLPGTCYNQQTVTQTLSGPSNAQSNIIVNPQIASPLTTVVPTNTVTQRSVSFHSGGANSHVTRFFDGTATNGNGAILASTPSIAQYHKDFSSFYTRNANDTVEIYCTVIACASLTIDGIPVAVSPDRVYQVVDGATYYLFNVAIANAGFHRIDLDNSKSGVYYFFVYGKNGKFSYGYEGGLNKPQIVYGPTTTPGTTTQFTGSTTTSPSTTTQAVVTTTSGPTGQTTAATVTTTAGTTTQPVSTVTSTSVSTTTGTTVTGQTSQTSTTTQPTSTTTGVPPVTTTPSTAAPITTPTTQPITLPTSAPQTSVITMAPQTTVVTSVPQTTVVTSVPQTTVVTSVPQTTVVTTAPQTMPVATTVPITVAPATTTTTRRATQPRSTPRPATTTTLLPTTTRGAFVASFAFSVVLSIFVFLF